MSKIKERNFLILLLIWSVMQGCLLYGYGININSEAETIIYNAGNFVHSGHFASSRNYLYFTETFLVISKIKLGLGYGFVVAVHLVLNLIALWCWYNFLVKFYASEKLAFIAGVLIICCYPYQLHNNYLATESVYFSISSVYSCVLLQTKKFTFNKIGLLVLLLVLLCITRPSGFFFFAATVLYLLVKFTRQLKPILSAFIFFMCTMLGLLGIYYVTKSGNGYDFIIPFKEEHVICGISNLQGVKEGKMSDNNSIVMLAIYLSQHTGQFFRLAILKSEAFWGLKRAYYSNMHNLFLMAFFYPVYLLCIATIIKFRKKLSPVAIYCMSVILIYWLSVVFTCDDWSNRFFLTLTPYLVILALVFFKRTPLLKENNIPSQDKKSF